MVRKKRILPLWEVPDQLWERIEKLIDDFDPTAPTGRKREDARKILDGLIFRFRTGCSGTTSRVSMGMTQLFIAPFSDGRRSDCLKRSGRCWSKNVKNWVRLIGAGKPLIRPWEKRAGGRRGGSESDRSGQKRHKT